MEAAEAPAKGPSPTDATHASAKGPSPTDANLTNRQKSKLLSRTEAARLVQDASVHAWLRKRQRPKAKPVARSFISRQRREMLTKCFESLDTDASGDIDANELRFALQQLGLSTEHADSILNEGDADNNGSISLEEFISLVGQISARQEQRERVRQLQGANQSEVVHTFTEMLTQTASKFPLGLLANAAHIRECVAGFDPEHYQHRRDGEMAAVGLPPAPPARPPRKKLPPMQEGEGGSRAVTAPLAKPSSHQRWLAKADKPSSMRRRAASAQHFPRLPEPVPQMLTHASTAPRLPKVRTGIAS